MNKNNRPKYNILQNVGWMIENAWKTRRRVLLYTVVLAVLEVLYNLAELYIAPEILGRVESQAPIGQLLGTIVFFTLVLFFTKGIKEYLEEGSQYPRIEVRVAIIGLMNRKDNMTSYPNTMDADFIKLREKANMATEGNREATEHIWVILTSLLKNVGGFLVYLTILSHLDVVLLLVVVVTCLSGFLVSRYTNNWMFAHREQEDKYYAQKRYIRNKAESVTLAKDIRIFGLQNWLNDLLNNVHNVYLDFRLKVERKRLLADITEAILTMLRNGLAYVYLINMALNEGLSVP